MRLIGLIDEDFVNYKKPCMVLEMPVCDFKCDIECGMQVCQNSELADAPMIDIDTEKIIQKYLNNPITEAIVFQGLEPMHEYSLPDVYQFIGWLRCAGCFDDIVIYTGYTEKELQINIKYLQALGIKNVIVKFGRFIPNQQSHYDPILGVPLASDNQYAKRIC